MKKYVFPLSTLLFIVFIFLGFSLTKNPAANTSGEIKVVAAENFWGNISRQLGGNKVTVLSVVNDPNADPHEYESSTKDGLAISNADLVIVNGAGYDSWATKLLSTSPINKNRQVINVADILSKKNGDNPHFWYGQAYTNDLINTVTNSYINIDPKDSQYFLDKKRLLLRDMDATSKTISDIKAKYQGHIVASTEDMFSNVASETGLQLISPTSFMQAVAEGTDPPASSVALFEEQLISGKVELLAYNEQTINPLTNQMKALAIKNKIPVVGITETITPINLNYQEWMNMQLTQIERALDGKK